MNHEPPLGTTPFVAVTIEAKGLEVD